jgi:hypothetical protein
MEKIGMVIDFGSQKVIPWCFRDFKVFESKLYQHIRENKVPEEELTNEGKCYLNSKKENLNECAMLSQTLSHLKTANTINSEMVEDWREAIDAEMRSLQEHEAYVVIKKKNQNVLGTRWVLTTKMSLKRPKKKLDS